MNRWECDYIGCDRSVVAVGGAIGLRAIGWSYAPGARIRCPQHREDRVPCRERGNEGVPCALCAATEDAEEIQTVLDGLGF